MLVYDEKLCEIDDQIDRLIESFVSSPAMLAYLESCHQLQRDSHAQQLKVDFLEAQLQFSKIEPYGRYAPDFKIIRKKMRESKRKLDMHHSVSKFKIQETQLQEILDYMCLDIAKVISTDIKIDAGNPFFEFSDKKCGGGCHGNT